MKGNLLKEQQSTRTNTTNSTLGTNGGDNEWEIVILEEEEKEDVIAYNENLKIIWNIVYWTTYAMCWLVLPILSTYLESGDFRIKGRLWYAFKINLLIYLAGAVLLSCFVIWMAVQNNLQG
jgi:hypothetical protein